MKDYANALLECIGHAFSILNGSIINEGLAWRMRDWEHRVFQYPQRIDNQ